MSPFLFFFFNDTATTEIYTLSLHDALPIFLSRELDPTTVAAVDAFGPWLRHRRPSFIYDRPTEDPIPVPAHVARSEEHTSELQSRLHLVCRLLLEKKKKNITIRLQPANTHN